MVRVLSKVVFVCFLTGFYCLPINFIWARLPDFTKNTSASRNTTFGWGGSFSSKKVQILYLSSDFTPEITDGVIEDLYFMYGSTTGATVTNFYKNLKIRLGQTSDEKFPKSNLFYTDLTTVLEEEDYSIKKGEKGEWFRVPLTRPFIYDRTRSLIVEISFDTCINAVNSAGLACFAGKPETGRKLYTPSVSDIYGTEHSDLLNMGISFGAPLCTTISYAARIEASVPKVYCGEKTLLSIEGIPESYGFTYQWQLNDAGTWVNFGSGSVIQETPPLRDNTGFRCIVRCMMMSEQILEPIVVTVDPLNVNLGKTHTLCEGGLLKLGTDIGQAGYLWSTGEREQHIIIRNTGTYWLQVSLPDGCTGIDTAIVRKGAVPLNILPETVDLCSGDSIILDAGNTGCIFLWEYENLRTQAITVNKPGVYSIQIKSPDSCVLVAKTILISRDRPENPFAPEVRICPDELLILNAGNPDCRFRWNTSDTTQQIKVADTGVYFVTIVNSYDCAVEAFTHVKWYERPEAKGFNAFLVDGMPGGVSFEPVGAKHFATVIWDFGDGSVSRDITPVHVFEHPGTYVVRLTLFNECGEGSVLEQLVIIEPYSAIDEIARSAGEGILLYPNPSTGRAYIKVRDAGVSFQRVMLYDLAGKLLLELKSDPVTEMLIDMRHLPNGTYLLKAGTSSGWDLRKVYLQR